MGYRYIVHLKKKNYKLHYITYFTSESDCGFHFRFGQIYLRKSAVTTNFFGQTSTLYFCLALYFQKVRTLYFCLTLYIVAIHASLLRLFSLIFFQINLNRSNQLPENRILVD